MSTPKHSAGYTDVIGGTPRNQNRPGPTLHGFDFAEVSSSLQKALRRSQKEDALYWAVELDRSGYGEYVWKRLRIIASEDVGLAEPMMPATIHGLYSTWSDLRKKRDDKQEPWRLMLVHAVILLARARKSRVVDHALLWLYEGEFERREIPDVALDKHTLAGKRKGRGWSHFWDDASLLLDHETGELTHAPNIDDPYRDRARVAVERASAEPAQLAIGGER